MNLPRCAALVAVASLVGVVRLAAAQDVASYNGLARANGRQIARAGDDWFVVVPDSSGRSARLLISEDLRKEPSSKPGKGWFDLPLLGSNSDAFLKSKAPCPVPPSIVMDRGNVLHVLWGDGASVWHGRVSDAPADQPRAVGELLQATEILPAATPGDLAVAPDGTLWVLALKPGPVQQSPTSGKLHPASCVSLGRNGGKDRWEFDDLATGIGFHPPVMHLSADGRAHIAWSDTLGRILYLPHKLGDQVQPVEPQVICAGGYGANGRNPAILEIGKQMLIVYETLYSQIEFAVLENGQWRKNQRLTSLDLRFATDVLHSPQLSLDRHGVAWLVFSDTTRKFTYFTRWLGADWSDIYDARAIYHRSPRFETDLLPADWLAVEKYPPAGASDIGISLANSLAPEKREFHRLPVPAPQAAAGHTGLFFDLLETTQLDNLELVLDEAQKEPSNPVLPRGPQGAFDQDRVMNHGSVLFDGDKFRMWYAGVHRQKGVYWWEWLRIGYAESNDGTHWRRVPTGVADVERESDRNKIPALPWPSAVFKTTDRLESQRPYKCVQFDRHQRQLMAATGGKYDMDSPVVPGQLLESADGLHWNSEPAEITFPDGKPWEFVVQSAFIDAAEPDAERRWKAYGYATLVARRRAGCFAYSRDGRHWVGYARNPVLDATASEVPMVPAGPQSQIHDTVVFPYRGYYLALFHAQHDANFLDVELAVSRDGVNFAHVKPGRKVIPTGPEGSFDWQQILQITPVEARDKLWLFYGGQAPSPENAARRPLNNEEILGSAGLATLRLDGFTHLGLKAAAGAGPSGSPKANSPRVGSMTTVPLQVPPGKPGDEPYALRLALNAACAPDARIAVEVLDAASGQPLPGYTREKCQPCQEDSLLATVKWVGGDVVLPHGKAIALRFWFEGTGTPKLYSYGFVSAN